MFDGRRRQDEARFVVPASCQTDSIVLDRRLVTTPAAAAAAAACRGSYGNSYGTIRVGINPCYRHSLDREMDTPNYR